MKNCLIFQSKVKIRRRKKSSSRNGGTTDATDDEGFESANNNRNNGTNGNGSVENGNALKAPLARQETDLSEREGENGVNGNKNEQI